MVPASLGRNACFNALKISSVMIDQFEKWQNVAIFQLQHAIARIMWWHARSGLTARRCRMMTTNAPRESNTLLVFLMYALVLSILVTTDTAGQWSTVPAPASSNNILPINR